MDEGCWRGSTSQISGTFLQNVCVVSDLDDIYSRSVHYLTFIKNLFHMLVCLCLQGRAVHFRKQQRLKTPKGFCTTAQCKSSICPWYEPLINTIQEQSTGGHKRHQGIFCFYLKYPLPFCWAHYTVTSANLQLKESHQYAPVRQTSVLCCLVGCAPSSHIR